jgi:hypothetical protein
MISADQPFVVCHHPDLVCIMPVRIHYSTNHRQNVWHPRGPHFAVTQFEEVSWIQQPFVILRIFMPKEPLHSIAGFSWSASHLEQLKKVRLLFTDGDSQEFNAVDEAIFLHHFPNARRIRCAYHLVQKTWENKVPQPSLQDPLVARLCHAIKSWVYIWMNGNSYFY